MTLFLMTVALFSHDFVVKLGPNFKQQRELIDSTSSSVKIEDQHIKQFINSLHFFSSEIQHEMYFFYFTNTEHT